MAGLVADFDAAPVAEEISSSEIADPELDELLHLPMSAAAAIKLTHKTDKPIGVNRINDLEDWAERSREEFMGGE